MYQASKLRKDLIVRRSRLSKQVIQKQVAENLDLQVSDEGIYACKGWVEGLYRTSHPEVFSTKGVRQNFVSSKLTGKHLGQRLFLK